MSIEPSVKIICTLAGVVHIVSSPADPYSTVIVLLLILIFKVSPLYILKRVALLIPFHIVSATLYYFGVKMPVSPLLLVFRTVLPVILISLLMEKMSRDELMAGLRKAGLPAKTVAVMYAAYSAVDLISGEYVRVRKAFMLRSGRDKMTLYGVGTIFGNLILRCFKKSERVNAAMICRGLEVRQFRGTFHKFRSADILLLLLVLSVILLIRVGLK